MSVADGREKAFYKFCAAAGAQTRSPRAGLGLLNSTMAETLAGLREELRTIIQKVSRRISTQRGPFEAALGGAR